MKEDLPATGVTSGLTPKQHFLVKIQVPISVLTDKKRPKDFDLKEKKKKKDEKESKRPLVVYNQVIISGFFWKF